MSDLKIETITVGLLFGASAAAGTDMYKRGKKLIHKLKKRYKEVKENDIPEMKDSVNETMKYVDYYLSEDSR